MYNLPITLSRGDGLKMNTPSTRPVIWQSYKVDLEIIPKGLGKRKGRLKNGI